MSEHGMSHEDARKRVKRIAETYRSGKVKNYQQANNLVKSLINQAERREKGSGSEIIREINRG